MVHNFFDKKSVATDANKSATNLEKGINFENHQLADQFYKPIIKKFKKHKVYSSFKDNILGPDLPDMQFTSTHNNGIRFLCVIDAFSKYPWAVPFTDKKGITITDAFQNILDESKLNKIWVDKGSEFRNRAIKCIQHIKENL